MNRTVNVTRGRLAVATFAGILLLLASLAATNSSLAAPTTELTQFSKDIHRIAYIVHGAGDVEEASLSYPDLERIFSTTIKDEFLKELGFPIVTWEEFSKNKENASRTLVVSFTLKAFAGFKLNKPQSNTFATLSLDLSRIDPNETFSILKSLHVPEANPLLLVISEDKAEFEKQLAESIRLLLKQQLTPVICLSKRDKIMSKACGALSIKPETAKGITPPI